MTARKKTASKTSKTAKTRKKTTAKRKPVKVDLDHNEPTTEKSGLEIKEKVGLGDKVEEITEKTGIKKVVDKVFDAIGEDCGCDERKQRWNELKTFSRTLKPRCISQEEYDTLTGLLEGVEKKITPPKARGIAKYYSLIFGTRYVLWCAMCVEEWKTKINHLRIVMEDYKTQLEK